MNLVPFILLLLRPPPQDASKKYDLTVRWKPAAGQKFELIETSAGTTDITTRSGEEVLKKIRNDTSYAFVATERLLKVTSGRITERSWTFTKAIGTEGGEARPYGFPGKTVIVIDFGWPKMGMKLEDGGKVDPEDAEQIRTAFGGPITSLDQDGMDLLMPTEPVKVGQSWTMAADKLVEAMPGASGAVQTGEPVGNAYDFKKAKAIVTLKSVEVRNGVQFGKVRAVVDVPMTRLLQLAYETPIPTRYTIDIDTCIDGKSPDTETRRIVEQKGKTNLVLPDGRKGFTIELHMPSEQKLVRKGVK